jgi:polysaccharide biosynthesis protein PelE
MSDAAAILLVLPFAALLQGAALWSAFHPPAGFEPLACFLVLQVFAAAAEAVLFRRMMPAAQQEPRRAALAHLWALSFFAPCVGGLLEVLASRIGAKLAIARASREIDAVGRPEFVSHLVSRVSHAAGARVQARLANRHAATGDRLAALVSIQQLPTRTTGTLLRDLLADPVDDLRLLAYGMLDQAENEIVNQIFACRDALARAGTETEQQALHRQLAELHFELVYQRLAQGDVYHHAIAEAEAHARKAQALAQGDRDAALCLLLARLALARDRADEATPLLERARELSFPRERLLPWLAEAAFRQRRHAEAAAIVGELARHAGTPALKPVIDYWTR